MGLVPPDLLLPGRGLLYLYGPRVIGENKRSGMRPEALGEIFGWIEFEREWKVEKNKSDILDDLTALEDDIEQRFEAIIALAARRKAARPLEEVADRLNERLKRLPYKGKWRKAQRRGPHTKTGTVEPTGTGPKHTQAAHTQPGTTFTLRQQLSVHYARLGVDGPLCQLSDDVVIVNEDAPLIAQAAGNQELLESHLAWAIGTNLCNRSENPQLVLPWLEQYAPPVRIYAMVNELLGLGRMQPRVHEAVAD